MTKIAVLVLLVQPCHEGDSIVCCPAAALSHCAMLHVGAQRMATGKGQLPARVASLLSNVATDESALTPCGRWVARAHWVA